MGICFDVYWCRFKPVDATILIRQCWNERGKFSRFGWRAVVSFPIVFIGLNRTNGIGGEASSSTSSSSPHCQLCRFNRRYKRKKKSSFSKNQLHRETSAELKQQQQQQQHFKEKKNQMRFLNNILQ